MATSTEPIEGQEAPPPGGGGADEDRSTRRLLVLMLWILGIAAIGLLVLLFWLLRPQGAETPPGQAAGYPIEVTATIYGYGDAADQLLANPLGVAFDGQGNVWLSDTGQSRVEEYTSDGQYVRTVGEEKGPGQLLAPYGVAVDTDRDRVYIADYGTRLLQVFTTSGSYVGHFPADDQNLKVFGVNGFSPYDVGFLNGRVVVASNDGLYFFDQTGHVVARWGGLYKDKNVRGAGWGQFNFPDGLAIDQANGRIYVADSMNRRIVALDADGKWLWTSGKPDVGGEIQGFWQLPRGVDVGPDGNVYVVDTFRPDAKGMGTGYIVVLSPDGDLLSEFGRNGTADGAFNFPDHLAANQDGSLWAIADRVNNRVVIFKLHTPYPEVKDLRADQYPDGVSRPPEVFPTPTPQPIS
jgi:DNA-binding beta-propeller fold protein YncE